MAHAAAGILLLISIFLCERTVNGQRSWQPELCRKRSPYTLQYEKDLQWGEDIKRQVNLDDITDGRPTVLALHTAHCLYCTTQAKYLGNMARDLQGYGVNISIIIINRAGYEEYTDYYMRHVRMFDHVYYMQDSWSTNAWRDLGGFKDDFYIYDADQRLVKYVTGRTVSLTNFNWHDELYDMLSRMGSGESPCDSTDQPAESTEQPIYQSEFAFPHDQRCKNVAAALAPSGYRMNEESTAVSAVFYFLDGTSYSVGQAFEIGKFLSSDTNTRLFLVSSEHDPVFYRRFRADMYKRNPAATVVEDPQGDQSIFASLNAFHNDLLVVDEHGRLALYSRSPNTDMLNAAWRGELKRFLSQGAETCNSYQLAQLRCKPAEEWLYQDLPFSWFTFDRFTVLTILSCGEDGIGQFMTIKDARKRMGHVPIVQIAVNPRDCADNRELLSTLEAGSRVHLLFDDGTITDAVYGASGDVLFYSPTQNLVGREKYTAQFNLMSRIRHYYKSLQDSVC